MFPESVYKYFKSLNFGPCKVILCGSFKHTETRTKLFISPLLLFAYSEVCIMSLAVVARILYDIASESIVPPHALKLLKH